MLNISKQNNSHKCHSATSHWGNALPYFPIRALTSASSLAYLSYLFLLCTVLSSLFSLHGTVIIPLISHTYY